MPTEQEIEAYRERNMSNTTFGTIIEVEKTINKGPSEDRRCCICWRDHGKERWGDFKRYEDEKNKRGIHYFCKEHRDCEMPKFCPKCKSILIEMKTNYFCYECSKLIPKQKKKVQTRIVGETSKKIAKTKTIISPEEESLENKLLKCLKSGAKNREDLVNELKRARSTIYDNLMKLKRKGLIEVESRKLPGVKGRPKTYWKISNENAATHYLSRSSLNKKLIKKPKLEKCSVDPKCECLLNGKCMSLIWFKFKLCEGEPVRIENPLEGYSNGSKPQIKNKKINKK